MGAMMSAPDHSPSRRRLLRGVLGLAGTSLLAACAGPLGGGTARPVRRLGLFHVGLDHVPPSLAAFREELATLGYREGENVVLDWRNLADEAAAGEAAREFVRDRVDLIVAFENQTMRAVTEATREISVVFLHVDDPVANGWIESLSHPGRNLTGFVGQPDLPEKRIEYFKELVPSLRRLLILFDPTDPVAPRVLVAARKAALALGVEPLERGASTLEEIRGIFDSLDSGAVDGVFITPRNLQTNFTIPIIQHGVQKGLPVTAHRKEFLEQGALFSYGPDQATTGRKAAHLVDRILNGASAAMLPVEQSDVLELVINRRIAQALGLNIPASALQQATGVIE
jgi:putative ABC transport system substrate-binding protein